MTRDNSQDKDGMRTDDINALAGQRADKKGGVAVRCDDLMANAGKWMGLASFGGCQHLYQCLSCT